MTNSQANHDAGKLMLWLGFALLLLVVPWVFTSNLSMTMLSQMGIAIIACLSYNLLLANGVCPEQARAVLPQSMMTEWYWTGSLYGFSRVCKLRLDPHAQLECQLVAKGIDAACREAFPISWSVLNGQVD